jgi:nickel-dependent lactate racemase
MHISLPYGHRSLPLDVPAARLLSVLHPGQIPAGSVRAMLEKALQEPISGRSFADFLGFGGKVLILVNDGTRPTPTARILRMLQPRLRGSEVEFMIATGNHRAPTPGEFRSIFGELWPSCRGRTDIHDSKLEAGMEYLGRTRAGTEIILNRKAVHAERLVILGSVEPHYFAGYTGGRKSLLPGVAAYETITQNHRHALCPSARPLALNGNPVHEDMIDALQALDGGRIFSIQTVLDRQRRVVAAACGDIQVSFEALIPAARQVYCAPIPEKAEVVVCVAQHPMDVDLYQSQKAIENGRHALKEGGVLILVSSCREGLGDREFFDLLSASDDPAAVKERISAHYVLGYHKAGKIAELTAWAEIWALTDLPPAQVRAAHMHPVEDLQHAVDSALARMGGEAKLLILMDASNTIPIVE